MENNLKTEDLFGLAKEQEANTNSQEYVKTEYELKKKYPAVVNSKAILLDKINEYNNRYNNLLEFEKNQRKIDPNYSVSDYKNASDVFKFGLRWFHYEDGMAKRRGRNTNFVVSGVTYHLSIGQDTLVLEEHYPLLKNWASQNNFVRNPYNINNLYGQSAEDIARLKIKNN